MTIETALLIDLIGYLGGAMTLWGVHSKTIIPLRLGAVGGNLGFIIFGLLVPSYPTLVVHALLFPLNAYRTWQMLNLVREIRDAAEGDNNLDALLPYMSKITEPAGSVLFRKGDKPDRMIIIKSGAVHLEEIDVVCGPDDILGEIAAFTPDNRRTCTAICVTKCDLYTLTNDDMIQLYFQNPQFGMYLMRIVVGRLLDNWHNAEARAKAV
ncbi:MAG: cyclic nucleotide-binding domain-containing protein [Rhodospirillales bacterium]|nr:cyclic nucleotide-binding domain-containing protein [Rhodospirillales bacterium]